MKENNSFKFKKALGQNFLSDKNLLKSLVALTPINENSRILEIGLGKGGLTEVLISQAKQVVGYEIDKELIPILSEKFADKNNFKLVFADGLKTDIKQIENDFEFERFSVIANIPYYITSPLIFKFLEETNNVDFIAVMIQKEVAQRIVANKSTDNYGALSVICQYHADCKIKKIVSKKMFFPVPKVDSVFIVLEKNKLFDFEYSFLVRTSFAMRRKTLMNNLASGYKLSKEVLSDIFKKLELNENVRAENLSPAEFFLLLQQIKTISGK